jgi:hypothetical protein
MLSSQATTYRLWTWTGKRFKGHCFKREREREKKSDENPQQTAVKDTSSLNENTHFHNFQRGRTLESTNTTKVLIFFLGERGKGRGD